jgi:hypothetical protein
VALVHLGSEAHNKLVLAFRKIKVKGYPAAPMVKGVSGALRDLGEIPSRPDLSRIIVYVGIY